MKNSIEVYLLKIGCDYETGERCGVSGTFQIENLIAETSLGELDIINFIDQGKYYYDLHEVLNDLNLHDVDIEEL